MTHPGLRGCSAAAIPLHWRMLSDSAPLPDDVATLQALVAGLSAQLAEREQAVSARDRIIETLKGQLAALRRRTCERAAR